MKWLHAAEWMPKAWMNGTVSHSLIQFHWIQLVPLLRFITAQCFHLHFTARLHGAWSLAPVSLTRYTSLNSVILPLTRSFPFTHHSLHSMSSLRSWFRIVNVIITVLDCTNRYCNDLGWSVVRCEKPIEHRYILFSFLM